MTPRASSADGDDADASADGLDEAAKASDREARYQQTSRLAKAFGSQRRVRDLRSKEDARVDAARTVGSTAELLSSIQGVPGEAAGEGAAGDVAGIAAATATAARSPSVPRTREELLAAATAGRAIPPHVADATSASTAYPTRLLAPAAIRDTLEPGLLARAAGRPELVQRLVERRAIATAYAAARLAAWAPLAAADFPAGFSPDDEVLGPYSREQLEELDERFVRAKEEAEQERERAGGEVEAEGAEEAGAGGEERAAGAGTGLVSGSAPSAASSAPSQAALAEKKKTKLPSAPRFQYRWSSAQELLPDPEQLSGACTNAYASLHERCVLLALADALLALSPRPTLRRGPGASLRFAAEREQLPEARLEAVAEAFYAPDESGRAVAKSPRNAKLLRAWALVAAARAEPGSRLPAEAFATLAGELKTRPRDLAQTARETGMVVRAAPAGQGGGEARRLSAELVPEGRGKPLKDYFPEHKSERASRGGR